MRAVWKYKLPSPLCGVSMPKGAIVRHFGQQHGDLVIWVEVETNNAEETRPFLCVNTGAEIPPDGLHTAIYHGTTSIEGIVWHLYEGKPR